MIKVAEYIVYIKGGNRMNAYSSPLEISSKNIKSFKSNFLE